MLDGVIWKSLRIRLPQLLVKVGQKSVLLKLIAGIYSLDAGTIDCVRILESGETVPIALSDIGFSYMFQNNALFDSLTAFENVALPLGEGKLKVDPSTIRNTVDDLFEQLDPELGKESFPVNYLGV